MAWTSAHRNCFPKAETRRWRSSSIRRYEPQIFRTLELNYNILFSDMYLEWGGGDFSTLGYIFHGQDEFYNLEHEPVSEKVSFTLFLNQLSIQRRINYYRLLRRLSMSYFEF